MGLEATKNIHRILIDPRDENTVYVGAIGNPYGEHPERGVFKTTDGGETWEKILYVDEKTGVGEMIMDPANPNKIFVNMWQHKRWPWFFKSGGKSSGLYVTLDSGKNWQKLNKNIPGIPEHKVSRVEASHHYPGTAYVTFTGRRSDDFRPFVYKTTDYGATFSSLANNLPDEPINVITDFAGNALHGLTCRA